MGALWHLPTALPLSLRPTLPAPRRAACGGQGHGGRRRGGERGQGSATLHPRSTSAARWGAALQQGGHRAW
eukprot:2916979-Rhodomonas_salina.1